MNDFSVNSTLLRFLELAAKNHWPECDAIVSEVSDDPVHLAWATSKGLADERLDARDLAISIFEQTKQPKLNEFQIDGLKKILVSDENLHLRRKAAFALFKYGDRSQGVIERIKDAVSNDKELKDIANNFLSKL